MRFLEKYFTVIPGGDIAWWEARHQGGGLRGKHNLPVVGSEVGFILARNLHTDTCTAEPLERSSRICFSHISFFYSLC